MQIFIMAWLPSPGTGINYSSAVIKDLCSILYVVYVHYIHTIVRCTTLLCILLCTLLVDSYKDTPPSLIQCAG